MSNIDKRALREAAEKAISEEGETWWNEHQLASDYGLALHRTDAKFIVASSPATVLALLYELEAKDKAWSAQDNHINQQADRIESLEKKNGELGRALGAAEKLIAELQARENIVIIKRPVIGRAYSALNRVWTEQEVRKACELAGIKLSIAAAGKGE